jgi:hypothetical protein
VETLIWVAVFCLMIGASGGLLVAALAVAASRADDLMDVFREDEDEEDLR